MRRGRKIWWLLFWQIQLALVGLIFWVGYLFVQATPWMSALTAGASAFERGDLAAAVGHFEVALGEAETAAPRQSDLAYTIDLLASLYALSGRYAEAEPLAKRAVAIREAALGPDHPDLAHSLHILGGLHAMQARYAEAEARARRALALREPD